MKTVKQQSPRRHGPKSKYPWVEWESALRANKKKGHDYWMVLDKFTCLPAALSNYIRVRMREKKLDVEIVIVGREVHVRAK